jgi:hypothetical protein
MKHAAALQLYVVALILLGCLLMPRAGGAVLLVPVFAPTAGAVGAGSIAVLRAGWIPGSLLVKIDGEVPVMALLQRGILPLGAPGRLCSPAAH